MTEQEAQRFISLLLAVPGSRNAQVGVSFRDETPNPIHMAFDACFFIGEKCYLGYGNTPEEAVVKAIHEWAKVPLRLVGEA